MEYGGHRYGLSREAIESVAREGLACCVHMELEVEYCFHGRYRSVGNQLEQTLLLLCTCKKYTNHEDNKIKKKSFGANTFHDIYEINHSSLIIYK